MNRKAQENMIGMLVGVFIIVIVGAILFIQVAQDVGTTRNTITTTNLSIVGPPSYGSLELEGQEIFGTPVVINRTQPTVGNQTANSSVFSFTEVVGADGLKTINMSNNGYPTWVVGGTTLFITYEYGPDGYIDSSGGRSMAALIPIFMALLIAFVALNPTLKSKILEGMGR